MKIYAVHLLNDFSGSPKILSQLIKIWIQHSHQVVVYTNIKRVGFLSNIQDVAYCNVRYRFYNNSFVRLLVYFLNQINLFCRICWGAKKNEIIYVNTVLPFAAALAGKLKGCRVIYHIHETSVNPKLFKKFLFKIARITASDTIYVSEFLMQQEHKGEGRCHVVYNALEKSFVESALEFKKLICEYSNVLMVSSLKYYKGLDQFITLASDNPYFKFRLVLNTSKQQVKDFAKTILQSNIEVYGPSSNLNKHYQWADLVVNLSHSDNCIEAFGLTVLEGMAYGLPAIVPQVGGITEIIEHDVNGYQVDSKDRQELSDCLNLLLTDREIYRRMSENALNKVRFFNEETFIKQNLEIVGGF
ncbi:MAG: glycosyltransferase family 4 protein [Bacteroidales bacterium]